ncbi:MAG: lanthionine synthetase C family protein [Romboutsia sp.]
MQENCKNLILLNHSDNLFAEEILDEKYVNTISKIINKYYMSLKKNVESMNFEELIPALLALGEGYQFFVDKNEWNVIVNSLMIKIRNEIYQNKMEGSLSLYGGLSDIGFSVLSISKNTDIYNKFLESLNDLICCNIDYYLDYLYNNFENLSMPHYDTVKGAAGLLRYLIEFNSEVVEEKCKKLLEYLVFLTKDREIFENIFVPGWYIKQKNHFDVDKNMYPNGSVNMGISHGIAGPLVALSLAYEKGIVVDGQLEAINKITYEYEKMVVYTHDGYPYWASMLSIDDYIKENWKVALLNKRMSWCYGSIGVLMALKIGFRCTNNYKKTLSVNEELQMVLQMQRNEYCLDSACLCHGYSGILMALMCQYRESPDTNMKSIINLYLRLILEYYDETATYGFYEIEKYYCDGKLVNKQQDSNGLLTGATGIILSIISVFKELDYEKHLLIK